MSFTSTGRTMARAHASGLNPHRWRADAHASAMNARAAERPLD
jgi:hypothetical protein